MFKFLQIQYRLGRLTPEQLRGYAPRWLTAEQAEGIINTSNNNIQ